METEKNSGAGPDICPGKAKQLDLVQLRADLQRKNGPEYWRSLQELAGDPQVQEMIHREFPKGASEWLDPVTRRGFLKVMAASLALAGLSACTKQPLEPIVPYVRQPEELIPGKPLYFASAMTLGGYAHPVLVESHMGRPTKIEGNPEHPAGQMGTDAFMQASVLSLYDPDRSQTVLNNGEIRTWPAFVGAIRGPMAAQRATQGAGLRFLTRTVSSPTLAAQMRALLQKYPAAKWYQYEPVNRDNARAGAQMAFGQQVEAHYRLDPADIIVSLDADFLYGGFPGFLRYAREYAMRRRPDVHPSAPTSGAPGTPQSNPPMNRLYVIESTYTATGAKADHRLPVRFSDVEQWARALATRLGVNAGGAVNGQFENKWLEACAKDLQAHRGACVVIPGEEQPPVVHALAHAINNALGNVGKTVFYTDPIAADPGQQTAGLRELTADMRAGKVDLLVVMDANPIYEAPSDLGFGDAMGKVPLRVHLGQYQDETSVYAHWHVNQTHYLEEWSDGRAHDGTVSIVQPLIAPLYQGKSAHEFLSVLNDRPDVSGYDMVRGYWQAQMKGADFEAAWRKALHDGFITNSALPPRTLAPKTASFPASSAQPPAIELVFRRDPSVYDGSWANNAWLQELPKPMTRITWDNPVLISPAMAQRMQLQTEDTIEIETQGRKIAGAVVVLPGHADNSVSVFLGYGRTRAGRVGTGMGFNAYELRTSSAPWVADGKIRKTGGRYVFASAQGHQLMEERHNVRATTLEDYRKNPKFAHEVAEEPPPDLTLYPPFQYTGYAWGMTIDHNACIGCNACVLACQSENNIPVVGKTEVIRGRKMHWLRVDTYYEGSPDNPRAYFQPVPCMHCENAPCEIVCPVGATVHSSEGLNDMVYNRCVGTRYCSNNCPYKVRRFNFFLFQDWDTPQWKMVRNPDVTVRSRGVMEKCTYCVQRINQARIQTEIENRRIQDGEVMTACQQACPADAIIFGDINDKNSRVHQMKAQDRNYGLLTELNTRPRTTYWAAVRNPNPEIPEPAEHHQ